MGKQKLIIVLRIKATELIEDVKDIIKEHIECELGHILSRIVVSDGEGGFKFLTVTIRDGINEDGSLLFRKHVLDGSICDAIRFNIPNIEPTIIGPYMNSQGIPVTSDFFIDESNFNSVLYMLGDEENISKAELDELCTNDETKEKLIKEWTDYIEEEESNISGKRYLKNLIQKYIRSVA